MENHFTALLNLQINALAFAEWLGKNYIYDNGVWVSKSDAPTQRSGDTSRLWLVWKQETEA